MCRKSNADHFTHLCTLGLHRSFIYTLVISLATKSALSSPDSPEPCQFLKSDVRHVYKSAAIDSAPSPFSRCQPADRLAVAVACTRTGFSPVLVSREKFTDAARPLRVSRADRLTATPSTSLILSAFPTLVTNPPLVTRDGSHYFIKSRAPRKPTPTRDAYFLPAVATWACSCTTAKCFY